MKVEFATIGALRTDYVTLTGPHVLDHVAMRVAENVSAGKGSALLVNNHVVVRWTHNGFMLK
jgi:hypothetical protein